MRRKPVRLAAAIVFTLALVASACSDRNSVLDAEASNERGESTGASASSGDLQWGGCASEMAQLRSDSDMAGLLPPLECSTLAVPLDHSDPNGESIDLELVRQEATGSDSERIGSLLFNPGGPGGSGIEFLANASAIMPDEVQARFDLVSWDPRGVAESTPVRCLSDSAKDEQIEGDLSPDTEAELEQAVEDQEEFLQGCEANHPDMIEHMSTADVAADMDLIRQALGDDQLNYVGFSYGTAIGATYATMFPDKVRAMVLDGSVSPSATDVEQGVAQAQGFERTYLNFVSACDSDPECALSGSTAATVDSSRAALDAEPLAVDTPSGERELTRDLFDLGLATALYDTTTWGPLARSIRDLEDGGGEFLLSLADRQLGRNPDGTWDNSSDAQTMVGCADSGYRPSLEQAVEDGDTLAAASPTFGDIFRTGSIGCLDWPLAANPVPEWTAAGAPPILVIGTIGDPATPYEWSEQMDDALIESVLLTYEGDGHTAFLRAGPCINDAVVAYLVDLTLPAAGTRCAAADAGDGGSFAGIRQQLIDEITAAGLPADVANCIVDSLENEFGASGLDELLLGDDIDALTESVSRATLGCMTGGS
ncbi:MAG: alpha/beta hydrolase [Actinomycetia bacterium]|nr:alpha/beta hydrolase [Actinomycetes bacterium]